MGFILRIAADETEIPGLRDNQHPDQGLRFLDTRKLPEVHSSHGRFDGPGHCRWVSIKIATHNSLNPLITQLRPRMPAQLGHSAAASAHPAAEAAEHRRRVRIQAANLQPHRSAGQRGGAAVPDSVANVPGRSARGRFVAVPGAQRGPRGDSLRAGSRAD